MVDHYYKGKLERLISPLELRDNEYVSNQETHASLL